MSDHSDVMPPASEAGDPEDTQPRRPAGWPADAPDASWTAPIDTTGLLPLEEHRSSGRCLLSGVVMVATGLLCVTTLVLSAIAGYRDELHVIQTESVRETSTANAMQYSLMATDQVEGRIELAYDRCAYIETQQPGIFDCADRMSEMQMVLSATPTPSATQTPQATATPSLTLTSTATETPEVLAVEAYFQNAEKSMRLQRYEDAIEWLDAVIAEDPNYRRGEVDAMLFDALNAQADIYFKGLNPVDEPGARGLPGNQLARGVQLAQRAITILEASPAVGSYEETHDYTAGFVKRFVDAQLYLNSGQPDLALPILQGLCAENCGWTYRGVSVEALLIQAGGTP
ncbi:MAG: tetratricopeptide repeat protein [Chloroflexi bacterium]|nr:tetratricopeptide repeat protein [Chloroflexota bacterium]